jgi:hypothetical protein
LLGFPCHWKNYSREPGFRAFTSEWLTTPNEAFGDLKPIEVIERGEVDRIWRMIYYIESGQPA